MADHGTWPQRAAIFGASGGIGGALCRLLAQDGCRVAAGSRSGAAPEHANIVPFRFDLLDEQSIREAGRNLADDPPELVVVATGLLTHPDGTGPEKTYKALEGDAMAEAFAINTIGPALIAKHVLPLFRRERRCVFAALSARVGSIADNGRGGWHSYRASKAALNMLLRNFAIEMRRTHDQAIIAGLHPGTVDTSLSAPFQKNLPEGQLKTAEESAAHLLEVIGGLTPDDSGHVYDWRGERLPE
ncbi:NAD(P)-dependent dehydrogenase (short-subunit alcohol dehydrogenase family) [Altererythrobacter atlanticus]|uniref:C-factor n=1 Tax=Croceibacterium atlanticum TaxID=1267766 RepID=A0A0F7KRG5_9SPHN|nr:SDR family NAD(P)-dependent oxidoreductase [Croceibacterium atlanticum]AKH41706.1 C-factor [Croceibacterium atlanticum]MBB5733170.1 NAD(P)-dependent dehydrogenase (short-subunit alcohol dehydrogenase family) [Croceibacterium atlanticum]